MIKLLSFLLITLLSNNTFANITQWHTPEGAKVLFTQTKDLPIVDIALTFDAASSRDGKQLGISAMTNAMIGTSSQYYTQTEIIEQFSSVGAEFSHTSLKDMSLFSLRVLSRTDILNPSVKLFAQIISQPVFKQAILTRLKKQTQQSIQSKQDRPGTIAKEAFEKIIFDNHPYAYPSSGNKSSVNRLTLKNISTHYQQYYVANNLTIAIVGDISQTQAKSIARQLTHRLNSGNKAKLLPKIMPRQSHYKQSINFKSTQSHLYIGKSGINRDHPDYHALYLANHIFGGSALTSVLAKIIREKNGLAYSVYSYFQPMASNGYFVINLQTKNTQLTKATSLTFSTLENFIKKGITQKRLEDAQDNIIGSFALQTASNKKIISYLSLIGFYNLPIDYLTNFPNKIKKLTQTDVQNAVHRFFNNPYWVTISAGGK